MEAELTKSLMEGLVQGHQEKIISIHDTHARSCWASSKLAAPLSSEYLGKSEEMKANWGKAGMPV